MHWYFHPLFFEVFFGNYPRFLCEHISTDAEKYVDVRAEGKCVALVWGGLVHHLKVTQSAAFSRGSRSERTKPNLTGSLLPSWWNAKCDARNTGLDERRPLGLARADNFPRAASSKLQRSRFNASEFWTTPVLGTKFKFSV